MAQRKKGGLINRLMFGSEKSEDYARNSLPSNRWELFWDIFKGRFGKLIIINLLILLFCIPLIALFLFRSMAMMNFGATYPFSQSFGIGYMAPSSMAGYSESISLQVNMITFLFMPIAVMFLAVGLAGGAYVMRNMVWTEGIFVANDFWRGIKQNIKQMLVIGLTFSLVFYIAVIAISFCNQNIAVNAPNKWIYIVIEVLSYLILVVYGIMTLHMMTMCVTYNLKFGQLIKNSFLFLIALAPTNIFFVLMCAIPFAFLLFGGFFKVLAIILLVLIGFSYVLLVWTDYSQWIYDNFVNDKVPGAKKNRGIYQKVKGNDKEKLDKYKQTAIRNTLNSRPIKPITDDELKVVDLPTNFSRADLEKLSESKQAIYDDHAKFVEEHKNDPEFVVINEESDKLEKERAKRIEKAKKQLEKRNKHK